MCLKKENHSAVIILKYHIKKKAVTKIKDHLLKGGINRISIEKTKLNKHELKEARDLPRRCILLSEP